MALELYKPRCPVCLGLGEPTWTPTDADVIGDHIDIDCQFSPSQAILSAELGCNGCRIIVEVFQYDLWNLKGDMKLTGFKSKPDLSLKLTISHALEKGHKGDSRCQPELWPDVRELLNLPGYAPNSTSMSRADPAISTSLLSRLRCASKLSGNTGSDQAILRVKSWLQECSKKHPRCRSDLPSILPTRALLIEGPEDVRIITPQGKNAPYACLSHCWGARPPIQTTTSSLNQYQTSIPWTELPTTFKDAVSFTYRLGIKYLWIDSLCILQDSLDDWFREGSKMSSIYQNAHVTLAAELSADSTGGLFVSSDSSHVSQELASIGNNRASSGIHYRKPLTHSGYLRPLDSRGWVFQERLLSPCVVIFERQEIWWECHEVIECECSEIQHDWTYQNGRQMKTYQCLRTSGNILDAEIAWEQLIEHYSEKFLTKPGDILPALQGLAKTVPNIMGDYLAGHWGNTLIHSLSWITPTKHLGKKILERWRAPTWSWASIPGKVRWGRPPTRLYRALCTVVSVQTVPKGDDPTGQLVSGALVLRGNCLSGRIASFVVDFDFYPHQHHDANVFFSWDNVISKGRHRAESGARLIAFQLCKMSETGCQFWLVLSAINAESTCQRIGLMEIYTASECGKESARIHESAAEEMEVTIV